MHTLKIMIIYGKTSNKNPQLLLVQTALTPGLHPRSNLQRDPAFIKLCQSR